MDKIKFKIVTEQFSDLLSKLEDLAKIDDTIKLKIDSDNILIYSMMGGNVMLAFKNYLVETKKYLHLEQDLDFVIDLIIPNAKRFVKNLTFIKELSNTVLQISYKQSADDDTVMNARAIQITGGKLKVNWLTGEHYEMRDINKNILKQRLDLKNKKWSFGIEKSDFTDIKKLSSINSSNIINIAISNGKVVMSETTSWEMEVDDTGDQRNANLMLNKKFLNCINDDCTRIEFHIFESFMLVKDINSNLMLSFEQDFTDQD